MPGFQPEDYVPPHYHDMRDIPSLAPNIFPVTQAPAPTTSNPTEAAGTFTLLAEMTATVAVPDIPGIRKWEATLTFHGEFVSDTIDGDWAVRLVQGGVTIPNTTRSGMAATKVTNTNASGTSVVVQVDAGTTQVFTVEFRRILAGSTVTSVLLARNFRVKLQPIA